MLRLDFLCKFTPGLHELKEDLGRHTYIRAELVLQNVLCVVQNFNDLHQIIDVGEHYTDFDSFGNEKH